MQKLKTLLFLWTSLFLVEGLAQQIDLSRQTWSAEVIRPSGLPVIPLFDGWYPNDDGTRTICFGYFNMNTEQTLDVPLGDRNRVEPALYDGLQPTHFDPVPDPELTRYYRHHWCVFSVTVPADFGSSDVIWTLETQGNQLSVPGSLIPFLCDG